MTPEVPTVLAELAQLCLRYADPAAPPAERAADLGLTAALLGMAAEAWDDAAANLVEENRALRALLAQAGVDEDLRISALERENRRLRAALIEAHGRAEAAGDAERQAQIWAELVAATGRRKLSSSQL